MNWKRVETIVWKEWLETLKNSSILSSFVLLALLVGGMPIGLALVVPAVAGPSIVNDPDAAQMYRLLMDTFPNFGALSPSQQFQVFILRQFLVLLLLLPIMGAMGIATYSIIGEKTSRSLEALLATPVTTGELLVGKSVAAALPPVIGTWVVFLVLALLVFLLTGPLVYRLSYDLAAWATMGVITPLAALLALGIGVIISSRVNDPRSAQQVGGVLALPIVGLLIGQAAGFFLLGLPYVLIGAVVLLVLDALVLVLGVSLFNREQILTRWK